MQAIILAAGMGKRLKELTHDNTKCMVKVNGEPLVNRTLTQLDQYHLSKIIIVTGYEGQKLVDHIKTIQLNTPVQYIDNPIYDKTNNIYSLSLAKEYMLEEDTLLLESDIIFEQSVLDTLVNDPRQTVALVAKYESWMDGTCVKLSPDDEIEAMIPGSKFDFNDTEDYFKTVNLYKFSKEFSRDYYVPFLEAYTKALGNNEYYEQVLKVIVTLDHSPIRGCRLDESQKWYEIDDIQDLDIAESMFSEATDKVKRMSRRYGGYWRYPKLLDFCYLVNSYYPPKKLLDEMKSNFEELVCQYPSGMEVNSLLAARNFEVKKEHIVVGNGAAELIKSIMQKIEGKCGFIRPAFEEYKNRYREDDRVIFMPQNKDFAYHKNDIIDFFADKQISNLLLVNPDNPSGNYIEKKEVLSLAQWCKERNIRFILDESFLDFADEKDATLMKEEYMKIYQNLIIIKSISKSFGIPGLRLGVAASADEDLINWMKKDVAIWNINSIGEFYMQIFEKYRKNYTASLEKLRAERKRFGEKLSQISYIRVIPSQANYFMLELLNGKKSADITEKLLNKYQMFVKDLSGKTTLEDRQYLRIAIRNEEEDDRLIKALMELEQ